MKIMFICTGNICRSAMAEGLLKKQAHEAGLNIEVCSCGIYAEDGSAATYSAIEAAKEYDTDITSHKATHIRNSQITQMNVILCATNGHKQMVIQMYPSLKEKVFTMKEYVYGEAQDISDPWGYDIETYRKCASQINDITEKIIQKHLTKQKNSI